MREYRNLAERQEDFDRVLANMIATGDSVTRTCKKLDIKIPTFFSWLKEFQETDRFRIEQYALAQDISNDQLAEKIIDIADQTPSRNEFGVDRGDVDNKRLRVDTHKWLLSKRAKRYSEKAHEDAPQTADRNISIVFEEAKP